MLNAIDTFFQYNETERNEMLQGDMRLRASKMVGLPVRLPKETQIQLRDMLTSFRRSHPELDLDTTGIVRAAIIFHLRHHDGRMLSDGASRLRDETDKREH